MSDKYYVYRPFLVLLGFTEGTSKRDGYNETLAYGMLTDGDVNLVTLTMDQLDVLQTKMLAHPKNRWKSSACGMYQIVRTTRRTIQQQLKIPGTSLFDEDMQDRMACYLLGQRGIDKWLAGRMSLATLIENLAQEWASLPTLKGQSYYEGQNAAVPVSTVISTLNEVKKRHIEGQPKIEIEVPVPVDKPYIPSTIEKEVKDKTNILTWLTGFFGALAGFMTWLGGLDQKTLVVVVVGAVVAMLLLLFAGEWIIRRIKTIRTELES